MTGSYGEAVAILREGAERGEEESRRVLAVALTNLARARLALGINEGSAAGEEAREAIQILDRNVLDSMESELIVSALTARATLCRILESGGGSAPTGIEVAEVAEEGLDLARRFLASGGSSEKVGALITELFRSGADAYLREQPHFLVEFLLEFLDPAQESAFLASHVTCHEIAVEALGRGLADRKSQGFLGMGSAEYERNQELLARWYECRERLAGIRANRFIF